MSFLTKFFIVLHVVLTMLVVSGLVVFVNRVEVTDASLKKAEAKASAEGRRATSAEASLAAAQGDMKAVRTQASAELKMMQDKLDSELGKGREKDARNATGEQALASANARLQAATSALKTAQETVKTLQEQLSTTRTNSDKIQVQNTETAAANADLNARLQTALRQLRFANEELEEAKNQIATGQDRPGAAPKGGNTDTASAAAVPAPSASADPINGVINDMKVINGINYATISVGSKDNVTDKMVFRVIERGEKGDWLGYITIDKVEANEASGRLDGPHVDRMKAGNEVRTQF